MGGCPVCKHLWIKYIFNLLKKNAAIERLWPIDPHATNGLNWMKKKNDHLHLFQDGPHTTSKPLEVTFVDVDDTPPVFVKSECSTTCYSCPVSAIIANVEYAYQVIQESLSILSRRLIKKWVCIIALKNTYV